MQRINLLVLMLVLAPIFMFAQFNITGKITDSENHLPLPGAHIKISNSNASTISDDLGSYKISNLKSGKYQLKVSFLGMETKTISIEVNKNTQLNISMSPSMILSEEVIISAILFFLVISLLAWFSQYK